MAEEKNLFKRGSIYWLRITIAGREIRESLHTTSGKTARNRRNERIRELEQAAGQNRLIKLFAEAVVEFSQCLETKNYFGWGAETQKR